MHGCAQCAELEALLEKTAVEYWNVIHKYRGAPESEKDPSAVTQLMSAAKAAMDNAQQLYNEHLAAIGDAG